MLHDVSACVNEMVLLCGHACYVTCKCHRRWGMGMCQCCSVFHGMSACVNTIVRSMVCV